MSLKGVEMGSLQGPVICPVVRAKHTGSCSVPLYMPSVKAANLVRSGFWGLKGISADVAHQTRVRKNKGIRCTFSSSSNGNGSMAGNSNESDADYVNSSVVEAGMLPYVSYIVELFPCVTH